MDQHAAGAREAARHNDGKFGTQHRAEADVDLLDPPTETAELADDFELTHEQAYEMNRAAARDVLDRYSAAVNSGPVPPEGMGALRYDLGMAATATYSSLRLGPVYAGLDDAGKTSVQALLAANSHQSRVGVNDKPEAVAAAGRVAEALQNAIAVGDTQLRTFAGKTAAQWRAEAAAARKRSADSFARSDTDGFLSQWAADTTARRYDAKAQLAEQGGRAEFPALMTTDGELVRAKLIDTRFGRSWMLLDENGDSTGEFVNPSKASTAAKRNAAMAKKGYQIGLVRTKAGVGMSDSLQPTPYFYRTDGGFDPHAEIVETHDTDD